MKKHFISKVILTVLVFTLFLSSAHSLDFSAIDITSDADSTMAALLADVDGDGDLDFIAGNGDANQMNKLYKNNGSDVPFGGTIAIDITTDTYMTNSLAIGDVDKDGYPDLIAGNGKNAIVDESIRLYLNNGTDNPWNGVLGTDISTDKAATMAIVLMDFDKDGDLDLVAANYNKTNRLYLNNGTADPWTGVTGIDITSDSHNSWALAIGDVDNDSDLDLVIGNRNQPNRLYLNNGTSNPWNGVTGIDITTDADDTVAVALGDLNGDHQLDLVASNGNQSLKLYLNNGTSNPWNGVTAKVISIGAFAGNSIALGDMDCDDDLDIVVGNNYNKNHLYLNNGTDDPFNGVTRVEITSDSHGTTAIALGDVDGDGDLDIIAGNSGGTHEVNRLYLTYFDPPTPTPTPTITPTPTSTNTSTPTPTPTQTPDSWHFGVSMQTGRGNFGEAIDGDGFIYAIAGWTSAEHTGANSVERFNENTNSWEYIAAFPYKALGVRAASDLDGNIYASGGYSDFDPYNHVFYNNLYKYNKVANTWIAMAPMNQARTSHRMVCDKNGNLIVAGGEGSSDITLSTVEKYDPNTNTWSSLPSMQESRANFALMVDSRNRLFAFGGSNQGVHTNTAEMFDPAHPTDGWQYVSSLSASKLIQGTSGTDGKFYLCGGWLPGHTNAVDIYDPETDQWSSYSPMNRSTNNMGVVTTKTGKIYVIGGDNGDANVEYTDLGNFTPNPTPCPSVEATITIPKSGKRISGNRTLVKAEVQEEYIDDVSKIVFQYRLPSISGIWEDIPSATLDHPNPDFSQPWFIHWDVSGLPEDPCDLRAVAYNNCFESDPDPEYITIYINHHQPDIKGYLNLQGEMVQENKMDLIQDNEIGSGKGDASYFIGLGIPGSALDSPTTCSISWINETSDPIYSVNGWISLDCFGDINLGNNQKTFSTEILITFEYPDGNQDGIVDGTYIPEMALKIYYLDENTNIMTAVPDSIVDSDANFISANITHFSVFGILGQESLCVKKWILYK